MEDEVVNFIQKLGKKGVAVPAAMSFLKDLELQAVEKLLVEKGVLTNDEISEKHRELMKEWAEKIKKMPPLPGQIQPIPK